MYYQSDDLLIFPLSIGLRKIVNWKCIEMNMFVFEITSKTFKNLIELSSIHILTFERQTTALIQMLFNGSFLLKISNLISLIRTSIQVNSDN